MTGASPAYWQAQPCYHAHLGSSAYVAEDSSERNPAFFQGSEPDNLINTIIVSSIAFLFAMRPSQSLHREGPWEKAAQPAYSHRFMKTLIAFCTESSSQFPFLRRYPTGAQPLTKIIAS